MLYHKRVLMVLLKDLTKKRKFLVQVIGGERGKREEEGQKE